MRLQALLRDPLLPIRVRVLRVTGPTYDDLGEMQPGTTQEVAVTTVASLQPVSSATVQREMGREVQSTHELYCERIDCRADDVVEVTDTTTGRAERYLVNGRPRDWGTHLEVTLRWQETESS